MTIEITRPDGPVDTYHLINFLRSNQATSINQKPLVQPGEFVRKASRSPMGRVPARDIWHWDAISWWRSCPGKASTTKTPSS